MHIFQSPVVTISMSDILEGILIAALGSTRGDKQGGHEADFVPNHVGSQ